MRSWDCEQIARAAGARVISPSRVDAGPERAVIDSRQAGPGALFVGLPGSQTDGGRFAAAALGAGSWGVIVGDEHVESSEPG